MKEEVCRSAFEGFFAEFYDILHFSYKQDIPFFVEMARRYGPLVLELGCGTGRLLLPIAESGTAIVGLDSSDQMLAICRTKMNVYDEQTKARITLVHGDMVDFQLNQIFALAFFACNTFNLLISQEHQVKALCKVYDHLSAEGILIIDNCTPNIQGFMESNGKQAVYEFVNPANGNKIIDKFTPHYDFIQQLEHAKIVLEEYSEGELVRTARTKTTSTFLFPRELQLLLKYCRFEVLNIWKNHNQESFDSDAGEIIILARKA
ncbi:class I SAM-dependent methyltransferase [Dehalococcoidia bacterium]|nr:class I SAM-dependent methyltransferase [Dehalococcoidia bacterium]